MVTLLYIVVRDTFINLAFLYLLIYLFIFKRLNRKTRYKFLKLQKEISK